MCAEVNSRSALYQPLTEAELVRVVAAGLHTRPVSQKLLTGGLFNTTYLVDTAHCGKVVLRMGPVNRHLLMPFEHHLMESEAQVYDLLAQRGVAASEILAVDLSKTVVDRDFMFVRYLPSRAMSECDLAGEDRERVCRAIGEAAGRMHEICADRFGRVAAVSHGRGHARWSDALYADLLEWETVAAPAEIFPGEAHEEIRRLFRAAAPVLDEITSPQLVHMDLWLGNVLIRTDTPRPEFGAIIDADRALWGDPMYEFSSIRWAYREPAFWEGYGKGPAQGKNAEIRRAVYTLHNLLLNTYVYFKEYNDAENGVRERANVYETMGNIRRLMEG